MSAIEPPRTPFEIRQDLRLAQSSFEKLPTRDGKARWINQSKQQLLKAELVGSITYWIKEVS